MSGGHWDYDQNKVSNLVEDLEKSYDFIHQEYDVHTIAVLQHAMWHLRVAAVQIQRLDWLVSGDDSQKTFHKRLIDDLSEAKNSYKNFLASK